MQQAEFLSIIDLNLTTETCIYFMILFLIDKAPQHHAQPSINHYYGRKHLYWGFFINHFSDFSSS